MQQSQTPKPTSTSMSRPILPETPSAAVDETAPTPVCYYIQYLYSN